MARQKIETGIEVRVFPISALKAAKYNPKEMMSDARAGFVESIDEYGVLRLPVVNVRDERNVLVSGHRLVETLRAKRVSHVECVVVRLDDVAERALNLALSNPAIQGTFDHTRLPDLEKLRDRLVRPDFARYATALERLAATAARVKESRATSISDGEETDEEESIDSTVGTTYALGRHLLYCGDAFEGVPVLLGDEHAHVCVTDPPYNVAYTSGKRFRKDELREAIEGDEQTDAEWATFVNALARMLLTCVDGASFVFMSAQELHTLASAWTSNGGVIERWIAMVKSAHPLSPADYHPQYELCLFGRHAASEVVVNSKLTNVIEVQRPSKNPLHPTQKPADVIKTLLASTTEPRELVLDPFAGSGTTICVAEEIGRTARACEIEPALCDTIRRRWAGQVDKSADWRALTPPA